MIGDKGGGSPAGRNVATQPARGPRERFLHLREAWLFPPAWPARKKRTSWTVTLKRSVPVGDDAMRAGGFRVPFSQAIYPS